MYRITLLALAALVASTAPAGSTATESASAAAVPNNALDGATIYQRVLDNRFNSYKQKLIMQSGDKGGNIQSVEMDLKYLNFRDSSKSVLSKSIAKYLAPQDVRHLGYLVINKDHAADDQFVYRPSTRRVRRINLRGEAIAGTDFNMEDILPREFEDATYRRLPDQNLAGTTCYVVELVPVEDADSDYSKMIVWVHKENYVPLRTQYWDKHEVQIKELDTVLDSITLYEDVQNGEPKQVWLARKSKIVHLLLETFTLLDIVDLEPNPGLTKRDFSERELTKGR